MRCLKRPSLDTLDKIEISLIIALNIAIITVCSYLLVKSIVLLIPAGWIVLPLIMFINYSTIQNNIVFLTSNK